jgi:hypothetical protein
MQKNPTSARLVGAEAFLRQLKLDLLDMTDGITTGVSDNGSVTTTPKNLSRDERYGTRRASATASLQDTFGKDVI